MSDREHVIRFSLKILENFVCLIIRDGFRVVLIPFFPMVKFKFLPQFPVGYFPNLVVSGLILFLN